MKKIILASILTLVFSAHAQEAYDLRIMQRNPTNNGDLSRWVPPTPGADCWFMMSGSTLLPGCIPVAVDWSAVTGKPAFAAVATSGSYSDLSGKPTIPAAQVNSDWNAVSGVAQILNKPTIPAAQVNSDWNAVSGLSQILNKPTIPSVTQFNFGLPSNRTLAVSTSYQASDPSKAAIVTVSPSCSATLSLAVGQTCTLQARVSSSTATCSTGTVVATWTNGNSGTLTIGLGLTQTVGSPGDIKLPIGSFFILCPTSGTFTITTAVDQSAG